MPQVTISEDDLFELSSLVYSRWASEYDLLKKVKTETNDGTDPDYALMHSLRIKNHTTTEAKWRGFRDRMLTICPKFI